MTHSRKGLWIVGYGSLIYKAPIHYQYRVPGLIHGFIRRFWQSSSDHRGTPASPGRVSTIIPYEDIVSNPSILQDTKNYLHLAQDHELTKDDLTILATAYYIPPEKVAEVVEYLDEREQDGYTTHKIEVHLMPPSPMVDDQYMEVTQVLNETLPLHEDHHRNMRFYNLQSTVYIGTLQNESFIGPEDINSTAKIIAKNVGPSGPNYEYLKKLYDCIERDLVTFKGQYHLSHRDHYLIDLMEKTEKLRVAA